MRTLFQVCSHPSGFDSWDNFSPPMGESSAQFKARAKEWAVLLTRNRDSHDLEESNFETALQLLGYGDDNKDVQVERFGHWACGWWEALCVKIGTTSYTTAMEIQERLDNYPVLDEEDFTRRELDHAQLLWRDWMGLKEKVEACQRSGISIFAARCEEMPCAVDTQYILG